VITQTKYPNLWKGLDFIAFDNGLDAMPESITLVGISETDIITAEKALGTLAEVEIETFAIGEEDAVNEITSRSLDMAVANTVLAMYFDSLQDDTSEIDCDGDIFPRDKSGEDGDTDDKFVEDDPEE
jgi:hypothetical protein